MNNVIAIDIETTGLEPTKGAILEIGALHLESNKAFRGVIDRPSTQELTASGMCQFVKDMHTNNGLLSSKPNATLADFANWVDTLKIEEPIIFLGASVYFDRMWILEHIPYLNVSHKIIDVSTLKTVLESVGHEFNKSDSNHRAFDDCLRSVTLYKECVRIMSGGGKPLVVAELDFSQVNKNPSIKSQGVLTCIFTASKGWFSPKLGRCPSRQDLAKVLNKRTVRV